MRKNWSRTILLCLATALVAGAPAFAQPIGPDVVVGDLHNTAYWGRVGDLHAYSVGTISCNFGDMDLRWEANNPFHPVIAQNLYRLKDGRIEQLGLSWLKHGFITVNRPGVPNCGVCPPGGIGNHLSPGCADPYGAILNGSRRRLGPRYEVNAATGVFPWPYDDSAPVPNLLARRIIVDHEDVDPAQNAQALRDALAPLMEDDAKREAMAAAARHIGRGRAAADIADHLIGLADRTATARRRESVEALC